MNTDTNPGPVGGNPGSRQALSSCLASPPTLEFGLRIRRSHACRPPTTQQLQIARLSVPIWQRGRRGSVSLGGCLLRLCWSDPGQLQPRDPRLA